MEVEDCFLAVLAVILDVKSGVALASRRSSAPLLCLRDGTVRRVREDLRCRLARGRTIAGADWIATGEAGDRS